MYSIQEISDLVAPIAQKYEISTVWLFGSYARGDATEDSDIDILVDREGSRIRSLFDIGGLYMDLCDASRTDVDLVTLQSLEIRPNMLPSDRDFAEEVKEEMRVIYSQKK